VAVEVSCAVISVGPEHIGHYGSDESELAVFSLCIFPRRLFLRSENSKFDFTEGRDRNLAAGLYPFLEPKAQEDKEQWSSRLP
jgi:hypothetical protein